MFSISANVKYTGYYLTQTILGSWALSTENKKVLIHGDFKSVVKSMVEEFYFDINEIEFAIENLEANQHDTAHFGMSRGFIYTMDTRNVSVA